MYSHPHRIPSEEGMKLCVTGLTTGLLAFPGRENVEDRRHRWLDRWIRLTLFCPPPEALRAADESARESETVLTVKDRTHVPATRLVRDRTPAFPSLSAPFVGGAACNAVPTNAHSRAEPNCSLFKDQAIRRDFLPAFTGKEPSKRREPV